MITLVLNKEIKTYYNPIHIQFIVDFIKVGIELIHFNGKPGAKVDCPLTALLSTLIPIKYFKNKEHYIVFPRD